MTSSPTLGETPGEADLRLPAVLCPTLPPGWVLLDQGDRLIFHARPSNQGRPSLEVRLEAGDRVEVSATTARDASYERAPLLALRQELVERRDALGAFLCQRRWLRARLAGETPAPDPLDPAAAWGETPATRDLWARALLRLALTPPSGLAVPALLQRAASLGSPDTRALAALVAILAGESEAASALLRAGDVETVPDPWIDAVLGCWLGDFARMDAALRRWAGGVHPRRVVIAAQLYAEAGAAAAASALALPALAAMPVDDAAAIELMGFVDPHVAVPDLVARIGAVAPVDPVQVESLAQTLRDRGELELARRLYARGVERWPDSAPLLAALAELQLWAGDYDEAKASIGGLARLQPARAALLDAVCLLAAGALDDADQTLRAVSPADRASPLYTLLQAELLVRRGQHRRARRQLTESNGTQAFVAGRLLGAMCALRCGDAELAVAGAADIGWISAAEIAALTPAEPAEVSLEASALAGRLDRALAHLRGNRSDTPTVASPGGLQRVAPPPDTRERAVAVLFGIVHRPPEQVLADFAALLAAYPRTAHTHCYRGELLLWLGLYDEAERDFISARDISPLRRWAYVGLAAVALMRGQFRETLAVAATCEDVCGANDAATLGVYAGEAHRRLGHRWRAARALDAVIAAKPSRLAARINRALLERGKSGARVQAEAWQQVCRTAPGLAADVAAAHPEPIDIAARLETCLARMLGNRSSTILSYLDAADRFRVRPLRVERLAQLTRALQRECLVDFFRA